MIQIQGVLEIDYERGVIYFHDNETGITRLRICRLPIPIPEFVETIDITHSFGATYTTKSQNLAPEKALKNTLKAQYNIIDQENSSRLEAEHLTMTEQPVNKEIKKQYFGSLGIPEPLMRKAKLIAAIDGVRRNQVILEAIRIGIETMSENLSERIEQYMAGVGEDAASEEEEE